MKRKKRKTVFQKPFPNEEFQDVSVLKDLVGTPHNLITNAENGVTPEVPEPPMLRMKQLRKSRPCRVHLYNTYFQLYGYSDGCSKCSSLKLNESHQTRHTLHTEECRKRMEAIMACHPELRVKLDEAHAKADRWLAAEVERCDERR